MRASSRKASRAARGRLGPRLAGAMLAGAVLAGAVLAAAVPARAQDDLLDRLLDFDPGAVDAQVFGDLPQEPQALADALSSEVAAIRGLAFLEPIAVSNQSMAEFGDYLDAEMERSIPIERADAFGRVVRKLGLHRGPEIEDAAAMLRRLATSQVAAYYNPDQSAFFVLLEEAPLGLLAPIYAHELYHGLQDQYYDLDAYLLDGMEQGLNDDEILARQAVVEGEATYIMNLWTMERAMGRTPPRLLVSAAVLAQSMMTSGSLASLATTGALGGAGEELQASAEALEEIPGFMIEIMLASYLKGMAFVHAIAANGWDEVGRLYSDPPQSTEQILHPAKWLERDEPVAVDFPDLEAEDALDGWALLESNVLGEFQLRVILSEFGMRARSGEIAAGWDGDRYAVLERGNELLLLLYTSWDDEAEAEEFATAYADLLTAKYGGGEPAAVERRGTDVLIVEGGDAGAQSEYLAVLGRAVVTAGP